MFEDKEKRIEPGKTGLDEFYIREITRGVAARAHEGLGMGASDHEGLGRGARERKMFHADALAQAVASLHGSREAAVLGICQLQRLQIQRLHLSKQALRRKRS